MTLCLGRSLLLVVLLLCVFCMNSAMADLIESPVLKITGDCKNSLGGEVAQCTLEVWFEYDPDKSEYPIDHVVTCDTHDGSGVHECLANYKADRYPQNKIVVKSKHSAQAHPHVDLPVVGSIGLDCIKRECDLWVSFDSKGAHNSGSGTYQ